MFIPLFIAILLGLVNPSNTNSSCPNGNGTVVTTQDAPGDPGNPGDPGDPPPGDGTGGDTGQNPPPKID
ncbi:hypothetical protein [Pedobacter sp. Leaf176]|uniref:hypothetical protein n=1 Tax=Pedobacter sp. Leaf176 TaxID=1736286 RepID=UPI0006FC0928|nr:hypothetical protein [Pedobacter sp. Leaf176]KQR72332.1 hypothetical protein ASF92_03320 [Pedobacter sp. Leaf176]